MNSSLLTDEYWSERYTSHQTGWDIGVPSAPLKAYIEQLEDKNKAVLIPGCGNAYEAAQLLQAGFTNITLVDISAVLVAKLKEHFKNAPVKVLHEDFFKHEGQYDLILEQTFFCALDPSQRKAYTEKMLSLLKAGGKLAGVLFNKQFQGGPPFGGSEEEYKKLFTPYFTIKKMEPCYNSILPRKDAEVFFILQKS
jgi:SAM-dependent methyltransferase